MTEPRESGRHASYRVCAYNFAEASENRIHEDETARRFGFRGGLVPGVADFGYLVPPVIELLGERFLEGGRMAARFGAPVYDGEQVEARCFSGDAGELTLELYGENGTLRASGTASMHDEEPPNPAAWPSVTAPEAQDRPPATLDNLPVGHAMATVPIAPRSAEDLEEIAERFRDEGALWRGAEAALHPARILDRANQVLSSTVRLGPWIHTGSDLRLFGRPRPEDALELRGVVVDSREHKGHEIVELDCLLVDASTGEERSTTPRVWARASHTAIVRPRQTRETTT